MATIPSNPPTSFSPGNIPNQTDFNTYVRDAQNFFLNVPRAVAKDSTGTVVRNTGGPSGNGRTNWTSVTWNQEDTDNDTIHDVSSNTNRLVAKTGGLYYAWCSIVWEKHTVEQYDGLRAMVIRKNAGGSPSGGTQVALDRRASNSNPNGAFTASNQSCGGYIALSVNDYVEVLVYDNDDDNVPAVVGTPTGCYLNTTAYSSMRFGMQWVKV